MSQKGGADEAFDIASKDDLVGATQREGFLDIEALRAIAAVEQEDVGSKLVQGDDEGGNDYEDVGDKEERDDGKSSASFDMNKLIRLAVRPKYCFVCCDPSLAQQRVLFPNLLVLYSYVLLL